MNGKNCETQMGQTTAVCRMQRGKSTKRIHREAESGQNGPSHKMHDILRKIV